MAELWMFSKLNYGTAAVKEVWLIPIDSDSIHFAADIIHGSVSSAANLSE